MQRWTRIMSMVAVLVALNGINDLYAQDCLTMTVSDLVEGEYAYFEVEGASPDSLVLAVWGLKSGVSEVENDYIDLCASFGIANVKGKARVLGFGFVDDDGYADFYRYIPHYAGTTLLMQAAQTGTCPDSCVSNVVEATIQEG